MIQTQSNEVEEERSFLASTPDVAAESLQIIIFGRKEISIEFRQNRAGNMGQVPT
jgi:hypothetical protein